MHRLQALWLALFGYPQSRLSANREDTDQYWKARRKDLSQLSAWQRDRARIIERLVPRSPYTLGDVGCGGPGLIMFLTKHTALSSAVGYDNSSWVLETLERHGIPGVYVSLEDTDSLAQLAECDVFTLMEIIEHVPHAEQLIEAAYERAKKGVFFSVPNTGYIVYRLRLLFGKVPMQWKLHPGEHLRFWTMVDMKWWLSALGFTRYTIIPYRGVPWLNRMLPNLFAAGMVVYVSKD